MPTPPYQFIAIARTIARGFAEQAIGHPNGEALTEAAQAIWRGIEVLEGLDRHERPVRPDPCVPCGERCRRHRSPLADGATSGGGAHHVTAVEDPERVARGLVRLAQSHRQLCADFLRDHRDGMDTPVVAKFAARIRMFTG